METITVDELKSRLDAGEKINLLDVREPEENASFNIGGRLVPVGRILSFDTDELNDWKNEEIICYCRSGQRSMRACLTLETAGFTNVKNLTGGMMEWKDKFAPDAIV